MHKLICSALALAGLMALGIASPASASSVIYDITFDTSGTPVTGVLTLSLPSLTAADNLNESISSIFVSLVINDPLDSYGPFTINSANLDTVDSVIKTGGSGQIDNLKIWENEPAGDMKPASNQPGAVAIPYLEINNTEWQVHGLNKTIIASDDVSHSAPTFDAPEPSTLPILASGLALLGFAGFMVRRRKLNLSAATA